MESKSLHTTIPRSIGYSTIYTVIGYKRSKGISIIMESDCQEARYGNMDLKVSLRHMDSAFLNGVETSQEETACLVLQLPITRMCRQVLFLFTAHPEERMSMLKFYEI